MGDKMRKFKKSLIILTAIIVILTVLVSYTFAAGNSSKLAAAFTNLRTHIHAGQYLSYLKDTALAAFLLLLLVWRAFILLKSRED
jgi:ABC-type Fe3+ transport system permease subunit